MPYRNKSVRFALILSIAAVLFYGGWQFLPLGETIFDIVRYLLSYFLIVYWAVSVNKRVLRREIRAYLFAAALFLLFWLVVRHIKYWHITSYNFERYLWYLYYVAMIFTPLMCFYAALNIGRSERISRKWYLMYILAFGFLTMVLTNDFHQLVFVFYNGVNHYDDYSYGFGYILVMGWSMIVLISAVMILIRKCRSSASRRLTWVVAIPFIVGTVLAILVMLDIQHFYQMAECYCILFIGVYEACLQVGLIPSNVGYDEVFKNADLPAEIREADGRVIYETSGADLFHGHVPEERAILFQSRNIKGGSIHWAEDRTLIYRMQEILKDQQEQLASEQELLKAENQIKERKIRAREQDRLYGQIESRTHDMIVKTQGILDGITPDMADVDRRIALAAVYTAHIKRRSNLMLISGENAVIDKRELAISLRETLDYMQLYGVTTSLSMKVEGLESSRLLMNIYAVYEAYALSALPDVDGLMVFVTEDSEALYLRMVISNPTEEADPGKRATEIAATREDESLYVTASFRKGEVE